MKVEYKVVGVAGWTTLLDESAGDVLTPESWKWSAQVLMQEDPLPDSAAQSRFPRGNQTVRLPLGFVKTYATLDLAATGVVALGAVVNSKVHLKFTVGSTPTYFYLPNAVSESWEVEWVGLTVLFNYGSFHGDTLASSDPGT